MDQGRLSLAAVALFVVLEGSVALALDPLGPPRASLTPGQFRIGADLLYGRTDLDISSTYTAWNRTEFDEGTEEQTHSESVSMKQKGHSINKLYANLGYGVARNWEAFLRLGGADAATQSDIDFAIGGGTKLTVYETGKWSFGGIAQVSWTGSSEENEMQSVTWNEELTPISEHASQSSKYEVTEIQAAIGACYQVHPRLRLYGGPFVHFLDGTSKSKNYAVLTEEGEDVVRTRLARTSSDFEEASCFGGYLGAHFQIRVNTMAALEYQHTGGADALAMTLVHRFGGPQ
jgi:hypothetical protein